MEWARHGLLPQPPRQLRFIGADWHGKVQSIIHKQHLSVQSYLVSVGTMEQEIWDHTVELLSAGESPLLLCSSTFADINIEQLHATTR